MPFVFGFGLQLKLETPGSVPFGILFHLLSGPGAIYQRSGKKTRSIYGLGANACFKKTEVLTP